jgi:formamidopyrimidine-DNA glycosylase
MPELPEVETILQGLIPHIVGLTIQQVIIRQPQLRWPVPLDLNENLKQQKIIHLSRRGKYLLIQVTTGTLIIHLGMSGSLRVLHQDTPLTRHDHLDIILSDNKLLRYNDPRRFGAILMTEDNPAEHSLLNSLGPEPLAHLFDGAYLKKAALKRQVAIKPFIMNSKIVTGIGNIYAAEALFLAKIHPLTEARHLSQQQCDQLVKSIKEVLQSAISQGGTTLKDFVNSDGKPGYFSQKLHVYGRANLPCTACGSPLQSSQLGQRSTVFCECCQRLS